MEINDNPTQSQKQAASKAERQQKKPSRVTEPPAQGCPHCGSANVAEALFCEQCGESLKGNRCPKCNSPTNPIADICEVCGTWLLDGTCKFCYAELEPQAIFCQECGNPQDGIVCPSCGTRNIFDFCSTCNTALTEAAVQSLESAKQHPLVQRYRAAAQKVEEVKQAIIAIDQELARLENEPAHQAIPLANDDPVSGFFSEEFIEQIIGDDEAFQSNVQRRQAEQQRQAQIQQALESRRLEKQQALQALYQQRLKLEQDQAAAAAELELAANEMQKQQFTTHQEARRFAGACKPAICLGWLCNFSGTIHSGPDGCAEPGLGGRWVTAD